MSVTLLVEKPGNLRELHSINLNTYVGTEVLTKDRLDQAQVLIENLPKLDLLIISIEGIDGDQEASKFIAFLDEQKIKVPIIALGSGSAFDQKGPVVDDPSDIKKLVQTAARILGVTAQDMVNKIVPDYVPMPIQYFIPEADVPCDVFLRKVTNENTEFQKKFSANTEVDPDLFNVILESGVSELYVPARYRLKFVSNLTDTVRGRINDNTITPEARMSALDRGMTILQEEIKINGLTPETTMLARESIDAVIATSRESPKLSALMDKLLSNKSSYLYTHTQLVTFVAFHIISNLDWGTEEQQHKLSFVAFFHDITLESDHLAKIHSEKDLRKAQLTRAEIDAVNRHALNSMEIVQDVDHMPIGADVIIKQHHGKTNGIGFASNFSASISPLAIVFIIAEDFVSRVLELDLPPGQTHPEIKEKILRVLAGRYTSANYRKAIRSLKDLSF